MRVASRMRPEIRLGRYDQLVMFVWDDVATATTYVLQVGSATTQSDVFDTNVGNVLTYSILLTPGTYFSRVVPYADATPLTALAEQTVVVS